MAFEQLKEKFADELDEYKDYIDHELVGKVIAATIVVYIVIYTLLGIYWSNEPNAFNVVTKAEKMAVENHQNIVNGYTTTATLIRVSSTLLDKKGGYLTNDILSPGVWLDNMPNWERGVLIQVRDLTRAMRKDISRSQSQSTEDKDLAIAEPQFNFNSNSWALPATEGEYRRGIKALEKYLARLSDQDNPQAQFYARADNLSSWLQDVETRLGSLSQRLSASVGQKRFNIDLAGDSGARASTYKASEEEIKTPWLEIDDVFYESRGTAWALMHMLQAVEVDFADVLKKKNAQVSVKQIIRELEATQQMLWSPMVLNGSGFGVLANHSLVTASYLSRANAAIIDLRRLLEDG